MAVPKTTEIRCRDGSVQARQVIKRLHKQPHPYNVKNGVSSEHQGVKFLCVMQTPKCSHNTPMSR